MREEKCKKKEYTVGKIFSNKDNTKKKKVIFRFEVKKKTGTKVQIE